MASAVLAGSASSKTITGALPPSSRWTFLRSAAAAMATSRPARTLPVIETICGTGLVTSARPVSRSPQTTLNTPGGRNVAHQLGQQQGGYGRGVGRLEHHGVARGQGRAELPHRHHHRVVPRRHRGAHPDRLTPDERGEPGHVLARRAALQHPRRAREEADLVHHRRDLFGQRQRDRLAGVLRLRLHQLVGVGLDGVRDAEQGQAPLGRGGVAPARERLGRRGERRRPPRSRWTRGRWRRLRRCSGRSARTAGRTRCPSTGRR